MIMQKATDFFVSGEDVLDVETKPCVITDEGVKKKEYEFFRVREICYLNGKIRLGKEKEIYATNVERTGYRGTISMVTNEAMYYVPRSIHSDDDVPKIAFYNKDLYSINKDKEFVKEVILDDDNNPMLREIKIDKYNNCPITFKGGKGYFEYKYTDKEGKIIKDEIYIF